MKYALCAPLLGLSLALFSPLAMSADKAAFHLFNPVPSSQMREFNTDRPNKTESPYTVDAGHLQVETDFLTYTKDRDSKEEALETRQSFLVSNLKVGLTANLDFQVSLSPYDVEKSRLGGKREEGRGFGDTVVRFK
ncbi:MAG: transporter, partial [Proteobacteria bacterium]